MGFLVKGFVFAIIGVLLFVFLPKRSPVPQLQDTWWGSGDPALEDVTIEPFQINVSEDILNDLKRRLETTAPLQTALEGVQHHYGINSNLLQEIVDFWRTKYDWKKREKFLNRFAQFRVSVQGLKIHYIHVKPQNSKGLKVLPLLLLHGWPGSVREFYELIPHLTTPQKGRDFVFEVIAPSLPGYGFSQGAVRPGLGAAQMSVLFKNFMQRIGFDRYYIQGGDWGALIVKYTSILFPEKIIGVHSNMCFSTAPSGTIKTILSSIYPRLLCTEEEENYVYPLSEKYMAFIEETGYSHIQATKPDTIGVALRDSPVGLAAYILEKFITWTNPKWRDLEDGGLKTKYTFDALLDNIMIYWVTGSITTSVRLYSETFNKAHWDLNLESFPVTIPSGCSRFTKELVFLPKNILEDTYHNLLHLTTRDGGHFAAFEVPDVLAEEIFQFVQKSENYVRNSK